MAKINQQPPRAPLWPWGGPRAVRERLLDPTQLERKKRKGDPKNPALASAALLEFIAPAHSSEEVRLPEPPQPRGNGAPLEAFTSRPHLASVAEREGERERQQLEMGLSRLNATPDRMDRLQGILAREAEMLSVVKTLNDDVKAIINRMWWSQNEESY